VLKYLIIKKSQLINCASAKLHRQLAVDLAIRNLFQDMQSCQNPTRPPNRVGGH
jgi:hypothetical protein